MSKVVRWLAIGAGLSAAAAVGMRLLAPQGPRPANALPLGCRLRGHTWRMPARAGDAPSRRTCARCEQLDVPLG